MLSQKVRALSTLLLSFFAFTSFAPRSFADATNNNEGFYDQTYEINNSRVRLDQGAQDSSFSGAFTYSLPLTLPAGRSGLQPSLSLNYNSQGMGWDSFYGSGWSLGIPAITRLNKTGVNTMYDENNFSSSLSGELVPISGSPYGEYSSKVEDGSFLNYSFNSDNSWSVTDKSGTVYSFGAAAESRQEDPADASRVYKWMLEEVRDSNDNFVRYEYFEENGQIYPESIHYTGHGSTDGSFAIEFTLESREDVSSFYNTGFEVQTDYRVSEITAFVDGVWTRKYSLDYSTPDDTVQSLLSSVTESAQSTTGEVSTLHPTSFEYSESEKGWEEVSGYEIPVYFYVEGGNEDKGVDISDVNGDGFMDLLNSYYDSGRTYREVYVNNGDGTGWTEDTSYSIPVSFWGTGGNYMRGTRMSDLNGDGFNDIVYASMESSSDVRVGYIFDEASSSWVEDTTYSIPLRFNSGYMADEGIRVMDINGDSFPDFVQSLSHGGISKNIYLFNPEMETWEEVSEISIPVIFNSEGEDDEGVKLADINGDGLVDIIESRYQGSPYQSVYLNRGDGTGWTEESSYSIPIYFWDSGDIMMDVAEMVDVNGDGLADIVYSADSSIENAVYINKGDGTGWDEGSAYTVPVSFAEGYRTPKGVQIFDVDGDNFADVVFSESHGGSTKRMYLNNATPELLETIHHSKGAETTVSYAPSTSFDNPAMPFVMNLVSSVTTSDGLGEESTITYDYSGGKYLYEDEMNRQFAGFETVSRSEEGKETISYYHQEEFPLIGRAYKTEVYDESGNLFQRVWDSWETLDLGYENDFVYKTASVSMDFGGSAHKDKATTYQYDADGNIFKVTNFGEVAADSSGGFVDIPHAHEKTVLSYAYAADSSGLIRNKISEEILKDASGSAIAKSRRTYDGLPLGNVSTGNLTSEKSWLSEGNQWFGSTYTVNAYGLVERVVDAKGNALDMNYDSNNLYPASTTNALSQTTSTVYEAATGQLLSSVDANGFTRSNTYDGFGRVLTSSIPHPTFGTSVLVSTSSYDDDSFPSSVSTESTVDGISMETVSYFDGLGRAIQSNTSAEGGVYTTVDFWYDERGNLASQSFPYETSSSIFGRDASAYSTEMSYDALSRPLTVVTPVSTETHDYSPWMEEVTDGNGNSKTYLYNAAGALSAVREKNGIDTYTTTYDYDDRGLLLTLTDSQGNLRNFGYDSLGRKTLQEDLHDPAEGDFGEWTYTYDKNGNLVSQVDPAGQSLTWGYDPLNRMVFEDWDAGTSAKDVSFVYDTAINGVGKIHKILMTNFSVINDKYDSLGNLAKETRKLDTIPYIFQYEYDVLSRLKKIAYPSFAATVNYEYNTAGLLEKVTEGTGATLRDIVSDMDYSPSSQTASTTYGNGTVTTNVYDPAQAYRLTGKSTTGIYDPLFTSTSWTEIQDLSYSYDNVGNILEILDTSTSPTAKTISYAYDDLNRLLSAETTGLSGGDYSETYEYDSLGNMVYKSDIGSLLYEGTGSSSGTHSGANPHAVTSVDGIAYTYDSKGNLTGNAAHTYSWDRKNQLSSSGSKSFSYDATGTRWKTVDSARGTVDYYLGRYGELRGKADGSGSEPASDGTELYYLFAGSQRVAALKIPPETPVGDAALTYYHQDHLGGTALTTNEEGFVTQLYDYYPYGSELLDSSLDDGSGPAPADHSFTDKELDEDLGLYYFEARWYDSAIGRFSSQDPAQLDDRIFQILTDPQSLNFYSYSRNNPVNITDPTGELSTTTYLATFFVPGVREIYTAGLTLAWGLQFSNPITSSLLSHSLELNPGSVSINEGNQSEWGNVIDSIKGTDEFQSKVGEIVSNAEFNGQTSIEGTDGQRGLRLNETSDLKMSIGTAGMQVTGSQLENGAWDLDVSISDKYHFDAGFEYSGGATYDALNTGAAAAQTTGFISEFTESINFDYTYE
ncbi:MAG: SpvB/TcaC N-terminal domain-containing protein [Candidatus Gracilibacteria bacterium]|jgi:RHS repeat-associated protein